MSNSPHTPGPPDPLDVLLDELREAPPVPGAIKREVWHRVAMAESAEKTASPFRFWAGLREVFSRPSFATIFVLACGFLGLFLAEAKVSKAEAARSAQIARSYLMLINPLVAGDGVTQVAAREEGRP